MLSSDLIAEAIGWRRELHQNPELAYQERRTADFVAERLEQWGLQVCRGVAGTGVVGTLARGTSRRSLGIRADMDALPIAEDSGVAHASTFSQVMHACGHDGHVAMLLAAARACAGLANLDGTVHFIFQPAEEGERGAKRMVEEGLFRRFPCESVYALHNWPALPVGTCAAREGAVLAALARFEIAIVGQGCHGTFPHEGTDCILAGSLLVSALQSIVSRNVDPRETAVVSITQVKAGDTWNVVPDICMIHGTTRWFSDHVGDILEQRLREVSMNLAKAMGCDAKVKYERLGPATINDKVATNLVRSVAISPPLNLTLVDVAPSTGAEDFAYMLQEIPGCYLLLGAGKTGTNPGLHSSHFDFNDEILPLGAGLWVSLIKRVLVSE